MRTASILLALIVVLGFVTEAGAQELGRIYHTYVQELNGQCFGFQDGGINNREGGWNYWSQVYLGPFGQHDAPFTATQGLLGFIVIVAVLAIVTIAAVVG